MTRFMCGLDESYGRNNRQKFFMGGFVAPETEWSASFTPAWEMRVLSGPPRIPYLHMTDIRSRKWREKFGLSKIDADDRVDAAIDIISKGRNLSPIGIDIDGGEARDRFSGMRVVHPTGGNAPLDPDYICFLGYSYLVLSLIAHTYGDAEKVDFIIETNGRATKYIQAFHSGLSNCLSALGLSDLARLVGELIPSGKEHALLQAADLLCWHTARPKENMDELDIRRYSKLGRKTGMRAEMNGDFLVELAAALSEP